MKKSTIILVDDHPIFLKGLIEILQEELPQAQVFAFKSPIEALKNIAIHQPDIAILDLDMPEMNGLALSDEMKSLYPSIKIIILTMHKEPSIIRSVIAKGVNGFVFKDDAVNELTMAVEQVFEGKTYISKHNIAEIDDEQNFLASLTKTECLVLKNIADQKTSKEIADLLFVSVKTIENHRNNISKKLLLKGSNSLMKFAVSNKQYF